MGPISTIKWSRLVNKIVERVALRQLDTAC